MNCPRCDAESNSGCCPNCGATLQNRGTPPPKGKIWQILFTFIMFGLSVVFLMLWGCQDFGPSGSQHGAEASRSRPATVSVPVRHRAITVTSQIVKSVGGKHRYFFDIRNNDQYPFTGSVRIELIGRAGILGRETFETQRSIQPGLGTFVFFDINTGPPSVHGEYGITFFRYEVWERGQTVASGTDAISSAFERLE